MFIGLEIGKELKLIIENRMLMTSIEKCKLMLKGDYQNRGSFMVDFHGNRGYTFYDKHNTLNVYYREFDGSIYEYEVSKDSIYLHDIIYTKKMRGTLEYLDNLMIWNIRELEINNLLEND